MDLAYIPSPAHGVIHLGPIPLRGYAFCIIIGVFVAVWHGNKRWVARGGTVGTIADISVWAVPFGLVGGRLYHVITDYELYFTNGNDWVDAFKIWQGGLGIWGAIAFGALGAWIGCRRRGIALPTYADAVAPGIAFAQAIGRWGNWFNQELYGKPTDLPWALKIDRAHRPDATPDIATYHPTFLYESLWCVGVALLVIWADRRFRLGHGRAFALYVASYTVGRFWIEYLRVDDAHHIGGLRLNDWTAIVVFAAAVLYFVLSARRRPGREETVEPGPQGSALAVADEQPGAAEPVAEQTEGTDEAADVPDAVRAEDPEAAPDGVQEPGAPAPDTAPAADTAPAPDAEDPAAAPDAPHTPEDAAGTDAPQGDPQGPAEASSPAAREASKAASER